MFFSSCSPSLAAVDTTWTFHCLIIFSIDFSAEDSSFSSAIICHCPWRSIQSEHEQVNKAEWWSSISCRPVYLNCWTIIFAVECLTSNTNNLWSFNRRRASVMSILTPPPPHFHSVWIESLSVSARVCCQTGLSDCVAPACCSVKSLI